MSNILYIMSSILNITDAMSHRERVAWLSAIAVCITLGPYLAWMAISPPTEPLPDLGTMGLFAIAATTQMLLLAGGHLWLRLRWPADAGAPIDERDRAIALRAVRSAYYILIAGMIIVGCVLPFTTGGWQLINTAIAVLAAVQCVHYGIVIWCYRRGSA